MTSIAAACTSRNLAPGTAAANAGVGRVEHRLVDAALDLGERAVDGQRARDVGGVEGVDLDAGVDEHQLARAHLAVVVGPVQRRGVLAGRGDRLVADRVALLSRACPTNVPSMTRSPRRCATASGSARTIFSKPVDRRVDGEAHLLDLVRVLDQAQLGERLGQPLVALAGRLGRADLLDQRLDRLVDVGDHAHLHAVRADVLGQARRAGRRRARCGCPVSVSRSSSVGRAPTQNSP